MDTTMAMVDIAVDTMGTTMAAMSMATTMEAMDTMATMDTMGTTMDTMTTMATTSMITMMDTTMATTSIMKMRIMKRCTRRCRKPMHATRSVVQMPSVIRGASSHGPHF